MLMCNDVTIHMLWEGQAYSCSYGQNTLFCISQIRYIGFSLQVSHSNPSRWSTFARAQNLQDARCVV